MSKLDNLLNRLENVRKSGNGEYMCRCPAHEDRRSSLAVKESDSGSILINCFAGCGALEILGAIGLDWADLYPDKDETHKPTRARVPIREMARVLQLESLIVKQYANDIRKGGKPNTDRLDAAISTISKINTLLGN